MAHWSSGSDWQADEAAADDDDADDDAADDIPVWNHPGSYAHDAQQNGDDYDAEYNSAYLPGPTSKHRPLPAKPRPSAAKGAERVKPSPKWEPAPSDRTEKESLSLQERFQRLKKAGSGRSKNEPSHGIHSGLKRPWHLMKNQSEEQDDFDQMADYHFQKEARDDAPYEAEHQPQLEEAWEPDYWEDAPRPPEEPPPLDVIKERASSELQNWDEDDGRRRKKRKFEQNHWQDWNYDRNKTYDTKFIEEYLPVPKKYIPKVIGKQASQIKALTKSSGCKVIDASDQSCDPVKVRLFGTAQAIDQAKTMIADLVLDAATALDAAQYVEVPQRKVPVIIGERGARIREIQGRLKVKIDVEDWKADPCKVFVRGDKDNVEKAKTEISRIAFPSVEDGDAEEGTQYLSMPEGARGIILGKQGSRLRELQSKSGARIDMEKKDGICWVRVAGGPSEIEACIQLIFTVILEHAPIMSDQIRHHG